MTGAFRRGRSEGLGRRRQEPKPPPPFISRPHSGRPSSKWPSSCFCLCRQKCHRCCIKHARWELGLDRGAGAQPCQAACLRGVGAGCLAGSPGWGRPLRGFPPSCRLSSAPRLALPPLCWLFPPPSSFFFFSFFFVGGGGGAVCVGFFFFLCWGGGGGVTAVQTFMPVWPGRDGCGAEFTSSSLPPPCSVAPLEFPNLSTSLGIALWLSGSQTSEHP